MSSCDVISLLLQVLKHQILLYINQILQFKNSDKNFLFNDGQTIVDTKKYKVTTKYIKELLQFKNSTVDLLFNDGKDIVDANKYRCK